MNSKYGEALAELKAVEGALMFINTFTFDKEFDSSSELRRTVLEKVFPLVETYVRHSNEQSYSLLDKLLHSISETPYDDTMFVSNIRKICLDMAFTETVTNEGATLDILHGRVFKIRPDRIPDRMLVNKYDLVKQMKDLVDYNYRRMMVDVSNSKQKKPFWKFGEKYAYWLVAHNDIAQQHNVVEKLKREIEKFSDGTNVNTDRLFKTLFRTAVTIERVSRVRNSPISDPEEDYAAW